MATIDWVTGKVTDKDRGANPRTSGGKNFTATLPAERAWSLTPQKVDNRESSPDGAALNLRKLHPEGITRQELINDSPKRWDMLHQFDKTKQQTREFLRQALQEEMEYDPECTFQPQISEKSELLMRRYSHLDFHERAKLWSNKKDADLEETKKRMMNKETYPFHPNIIHEAPKFKTGVVETKKGVKMYLDKMAKLKAQKENASSPKPRAKTPNFSKGPRVTVPEDQKLRINAKRDNAFNRKFDQTYLSELKGVEHKTFLQDMKASQNMLEIKNVSYQQAINTLHDHLYNLDLEDYASKIKVKRRVY